MAVSDDDGCAVLLSNHSPDECCTLLGRHTGTVRTQVRSVCAPRAISAPLHRAVQLQRPRAHTAFQLFSNGFTRAHNDYHRCGKARSQFYKSLNFQTWEIKWFVHIKGCGKSRKSGRPSKDTLLSPLIFLQQGDKGRPRGALFKVHFETDKSVAPLVAALSVHALILWSRAASVASSARAPPTTPAASSGLQRRGGPNLCVPPGKREKRPLCHSFQGAAVAPSIFLEDCRHGHTQRGIRGSIQTVRRK